MAVRLAFTRALMQRRRRHLAGDVSANAITEFALIAPVFLLVLMGIFDWGLQLYAKQVLSGAISKAARDSALEMNNGNQAAIDTAVREQAQRVIRTAIVTFQRRAYGSFTDVGKPEQFTDGNGNGVRDPGECFTDSNGNGSWDALRGTAGQGGGEQVVMYTATMMYDRLLPVWKMMGQPQTITIQVSTVMRNQPFALNSTANQVICT